MSTTYKERVKEILTPKERAHAIYGFDVLGNMALLEFPKELQKKKIKISRILLDTHPYLTRVYEKIGVHSGKYRVEKIAWVAGEKNPNVEYKEWGCVYQFAPGKVFFNPRLGTERQRVAQSIKPHDSIVVFFGGVGAFAIALAKHTRPSKAVTIEWNPHSKKFVEENIRTNKVTGVVSSIIGDVGKIPPKPEFDHVVMPAPETALNYLPNALSWLSKKGGLLHLYFFVPSSEWKKDASVLLKEKMPPVSFKIIEIRKVSDFSPRKMQVCAVVKVSPKKKTDLHVNKEF